MDLVAAHMLFEALSGDRLGFLYSGRFHDEHTAHLIALGEQLVNDADGERSLRGKLGFVMVESYQNIIRHRAELPFVLDRGAGRSLFLLRNQGQVYEVSSMNAVDRKAAKALNAMVDHVGGLDMKQLKELFLRGLQNEQTSERGGAGLGLSEMARRSGHGLWHCSKDIDPAHVLFALRVLLGGPTPLTDAALLHRLHALVAGEDLLLVCKGRLSSGIQQVLLQIVAKDLDTGGGTPEQRTRAFLAATELLEGVGVPEAKPLVALGRTVDGYILVLGTVVSTADAVRLEAEVAVANATDPPGRQRAYRDALLRRGAPLAPGSMGLLDLARQGSGPLRVLRVPLPGQELLLLEVTF